MPKEFELGGIQVGSGHPPYIIAEVGINHNGDVSIAKKMIKVAAEAGVDAVKFQTFRTEEFLTDRSIPYTYSSQGKEITESMFDMFKRTELSMQEWKEVKRCCDECGVGFLSTPVSVEDLEFLVELGAIAVKVGSDDFNNIPLLREYAKFGLPLLLSCGMANGEEMVQTLKAVGEEAEDICLLLCTSQYPTRPEDVNALKLTEMARRFPCVVLGFSDHTQGSTAAILACGLGARIFEKHFTLDHDMPGPDHWFSSEPEELANWVSSIRRSYHMLGSSDLEPTASEKEMRDVARRSIVALTPISKGEVFTEDNIGLRRPGIGIPPERFEEVLGRCATRDIEINSMVRFEDIA